MWKDAIVEEIRKVRDAHAMNSTMTSKRRSRFG